MLRKLLCSLLAAAILCAGALASTVYRPLDIGSSGEAVQALKMRLYELGYYTTTSFHSYYNENTAEHVRAFQRMNGLPQDGKASEALQTLLFSGEAVNALGERADGEESAEAAAESMVDDEPYLLEGDEADEEDFTPLKTGSTGEAVVKMKQRLYELGYYTTTKLNGTYNENTADYVRRFQLMNNLDASGAADEATLRLMFSEAAVRADGLLADGSLPMVENPATNTDLYEGMTLSDTQQVVISQWKALPEDYPETDSEGFLPDEHAEYVYDSDEKGLWIYLSHTLQVEIRRYQDRKNVIVWYETEVRTRDGEQLYTPHNQRAGNKLRQPQYFARQNQSVLAITDDFYAYRVRANISPGVIIRGGEILYDKPKRSGAAGFPKEEVLACFPDGSMKCFEARAYTAEEYLAMGATEVFSFGPILITEGQPGEDAYDKRYYHYHEPRMAMGMIEPNHYMILTVKGRVNESKGVYFSWMADRMAELHVQEALNLDGGGTAALVFMGRVLNYDGTANRSVGSIIAFGRSGLVQP